MPPVCFTVKPPRGHSRINKCVVRGCRNQQVINMQARGFLHKPVTVDPDVGSVPERFPGFGVSQVNLFKWFNLRNSILCRLFGIWDAPVQRRVNTDIFFHRICCVWLNLNFYLFRYPRFLFGDTLRCCQLFPVLVNGCPCVHNNLALWAVGLNMKEYPIPRLSVSYQRQVFWVELAVTLNTVIYHITVNRRSQSNYLRIINRCNFILNSANVRVGHTCEPLAANTGNPAEPVVEYKRSFQNPVAET